MEIKPRLVISILAVIVIAGGLSFYFLASKKKVVERPETFVSPPVQEIPPEVVEKPALPTLVQEETTPPITEKKIEAKPISLHPWVVQVSACQSYTQAKHLMDELKDNGFPAYLTETTLEGKKWYRVRLGFYSTKKEAVEVGKRIASEFKTKHYWPVQPSNEEIEEHFKGTRG